MGSFTPGPNTTIATVTGANYGFRVAVPHMFGGPFGFFDDCERCRRGCAAADRSRMQVLDLVVGVLLAATALRLLTQ